MARRRRARIAIVLALLAMLAMCAACEATGSKGSPSGTGAEQRPPTSSPGVTGAVDQGQASIEARGDVETSVTFDSLGVPAIWKPSPGGLALNWFASGAERFGLSGGSFEGSMPTSSDLRLEVSVRADDEVVDFRSADGTCSVTIDRALENEVAGSFTCAAMESIDGALTMDATGTFSATG